MTDLLAVLDRDPEDWPAEMFPVSENNREGSFEYPESVVRARVAMRNRIREKWTVLRALLVQQRGEFESEDGVLDLDPLFAAGDDMHSAMADDEAGYPSAVRDA